MRATSVLTTLLLLFGAPALHAQIERLRFAQQTVSDGLTSNSVTAIEQDVRGFVWIATSDGLNRTDGYAFTNWRAVPGDSNALPTGAITAIRAGDRGDLFIGTIGAGLCRYNASSGRIRRIRAPGNIGMDDRVQTLFRDSKGVLWIGTYDGLVTWDPASGAWRSYRNDPSNPASISGNSVSSICEDREGIIWIGTRDGLNAYNRGTGTFRRYLHDDAHAGSLVENYVSAVFTDSDGELWVGTLSGVLSRFHRPSASFTAHSLAVVRTVSLFSDNRVTSIAEDASGRLWVGVQGNGVTVLSRRNPLNRQRYAVEPGNPQSLGNNDVTCLRRDAEGLMWIGTGGGLNSVYSKVRIFEPLLLAEFPRAPRSGGVTSFAESPDGTILIGLFGGGVYEFTPATGALQPLMVDGGTLASSEVQSLLVASDGSLWIGTFDGLFVREPSSHTLRAFRHDARSTTSLSSNSITALHEDRTGTIWIGTDGGGLNRYDRTTDAFVRYQFDGARMTSIGSNLVRVVYEDRRGRLWIGTSDNGLSVLDRATGRFERLPVNPEDSTALPGGQVRTICEDATGLLWVGTNNGLCTVDADMRVRSFGLKDGLPGLIISGLLFGTDGNLWLSSTEGLARITVSRSETKEVHIRPSDVVRFDATDGLQSISFNQGACYAARNGRVYFGGPGGFNGFHPAAIAMRSFTPRVVLTNFLLFNKRVQPGDRNRVLRGPIESTDSIVLAHDQNVISFEFAALSYVSPDRNRFSYWLEGFDREPNVVDANKRFATYTNLAPGEYVLHVRGANSDGMWSDSDAVLHLTITPPWWRTAWAYGGYTLAVLLVLFTIDRAQRRRVIRRERAAAQIREAELRAEAAELELEKARELEKAYTALDESMRNLKQTQDQLIHAEKMASLGALTAGIAHEIRNPLNFITNFSSFSADIVGDIRQALTASSDRRVGDVAPDILPDLDDLETNVTKINEHGKRAESIVRGMLLHSRGKSGEHQTVELNALIDEASSLAFHGMKANGMTAPVRFERSLDPAIGTASVVPQEISRVLLNLCNNAFYAVAKKHESSPAGYDPVVAVISERHGSTARICVRDNGGGIPEDLRAKIFEPFFTTKPTGEGTGLGLSLSYDIIVKGHNGTLTVDSTPGEGTEFVIILPIA